MGDSFEEVKGLSPEFPSRKQAFLRSAGIVCTIVIDAEEDFNWVSPIFGTQHSVHNMRSIDLFQDICCAYQASPTYLLTYPILLAEDVVANLRDLRSRRECDVGIQLHSWVTPPFDPVLEEAANNKRFSYAGNLPLDLERRKLQTLAAKFEAVFSEPATMYRAGRYGLSDGTPAMLEALGIRIDTSVAPRTDLSGEGGPNYAGYGYHPFWFGKRYRLLEIPLCREVVGWAGKSAPALYNFTTREFGRSSCVTAALSWTRLAERITLSPEGNDLAALKRLADCLVEAQQKLFVISLHSSSLQVGENPYVSTKRDFRLFYDRFSALMEYLAGRHNAKFVPLAEIPSYFD